VSRPRARAHAHLVIAAGRRRKAARRRAARADRINAVATGTARVQGGCNNKAPTRAACVGRLSSGTQCFQCLPRPMAQRSPLLALHTHACAPLAQKHPAPWHLHAGRCQQQRLLLALTCRSCAGGGRKGKGRGKGRGGMVEHHARGASTDAGSTATSCAVRAPGMQCQGRGATAKATHQRAPTTALAPHLQGARNEGCVRAPKCLFMASGQAERWSQ
jgi:hypothetical protein